MVGPEGQKMLKCPLVFFMLQIAGKCIFKCKLRYLFKARLKNEKYFSNEKNLIKTIKTT